MRSGCAPPTSPYPPGLSWRDIKRRNEAGSSRAPSRLAHRARPIRQSRTGATLSRLLPPSPATPGSGCLQLHPAATTARRWTVSHLHPEQQRLAAHTFLSHTQHRRTAKGLSCTPARVQTLRFRNDIPGRRPSRDPQEGELLTVADTARELGLVPSTVHRWLNDGFIHGEQLTPGAPWRIRLTDDIRALLVDNTPDGWLATLEATHAYGLSRQTLLQRVKRGEIRAVYLRTGCRKGLRIAPSSPARRAVLTDKIQQRSSVIMHPTPR
jgi:hypothetical protein